MRSKRIYASWKYWTGNYYTTRWDDNCTSDSEHHLLTSTDNGNGMQGEDGSDEYEKLTIKDIEERLRIRIQSTKSKPVQVNNKKE